jgi:hypothetical protein
MKNAQISTFIAVAFMAATAWSQATSKTPVVSIFAAPDAVSPAGISYRTYATGISSKGDVFGYYLDFDEAALHGFIRTLDGTFTKVNVFPYPLRNEGTILEGINSQGEAVGYFIRINFDLNGYIYHGFIRSPQGVITTIDLPGAGTGVGQGTVLEAINDSGTILGGYMDSFGEWHFVLLNKKGEVTNFEVPGRGGAEAFSALNNAGEATGTYLDSDGVSHGWIRSKQGMVTVFDAPGAGTVARQGTWANGINEEGAISGSTVDENNVQHGMIRDRHGNFTVFDAPGANGGGTFAVCLNASNTAVGSYWDSTGNTYGFARAADGTFTKFDLFGPGSYGRHSTNITGINNQRWLSGWYRDGGGDRSFVIIP